MTRSGGSRVIRFLLTWSAAVTAGCAADRPVGPAESAPVPPAPAVQAAPETSPEPPPSPPPRASAGWPCWAGPFGTFAAAPSGRPLLDDLARARLVWKSEEATPPGKSQSMRYGKKNLEKRAGGGGSSPVVADGRVYVSYFVPSGDVVDEPFVKKERDAGREPKLDQWRIGADDVLLCLDAATGKTRWKRVFRDAGINWHDAKAGPCNVTPCVADGRVFAIGTTGRIYGVDAESGAIIWTSDLGPRHRQIEKIKVRCLAEKTFRGHSTFNRDFGGAPVVAGEVLVLPDFNGNPCGLLGLDAATGRERWRIPKAAARDAIPATWSHGGKTFMLSATPTGELFCVEAQTGAVLWRKEQVGHNPRSMTASGDLLLLNLGPIPESGYRRGHPPQPPTRLGCMRLTPAGPERLWTLPPAYGCSAHNPVVVWNGHAYARVTERTVCIELATGRIISVAPAVGRGGGCMIAAEGRILYDRDGAHNQTDLYLYDAAPVRFRLLSGPWKPPHPHTTSYYVPMMHPVVKGRLYLRGTDGVYCYDLAASRGG